MNTVIHAAVRRDIARLGHALDALPVGSRERAAELDVAWRHLDGQLKLLHVTKRLKDLLVLTKLLTVFECFDEEADALASFKK